MHVADSNEESSHWNSGSLVTLTQTRMESDMAHDLSPKLRELSAGLKTRANELTQAGQDGDIARLMSGMAATLDALQVLADEIRTPRSGPSEE